MIARFILLLLLAVPMSRVSAQTLQISEFVASNSMWPDESNEFYPWVEVHNISDDTVDLAGYQLSIDTLMSINWAFPSKDLLPDQHVVLNLSGKNQGERELHTNFQISEQLKYFVLKENDSVVDSFAFPFTPDENESIGRNPLNPRELIHFRSDQVTRDGPNFKPKMWKKIANKTTFSPRDSSPNASLVFGGKMWVLAGYSFNGSSFESSSDIWSSEDGVNWTLINESPPYSPYSSYIVFKNKMWAFDPYGSYSSKDGIIWTNEAFYSYPADFGASITVFKGNLWYYSKGKIGKSSDGINWTEVLDQSPWEGNRSCSALISHNNQLFFFGGGVDYGTGHDRYYNDVWTSVDGVRWEMVTANAEWAGRYWFSYCSFDNKLWLLGGWNYYESENANFGNLHDIWTSVDGKSWTQRASDDVWPNRHASFVWVKDNALFVSSGYGGGGTEQMYNDVWVCEEKDDYPFGLPDSLVFGDRFTALPGVNMMVTGNGSVLVEDTTITAVQPGEVQITLAYEGDQDYYPSYLEKTIEIQKRKLYISVSDTFKLFNEPNPEFKIRYSGFAFGQNKSDLQELPVVQTLANEHSPVGEYTVSLQGGASSTYQLISAPGKLKILFDEDVSVLTFPNPVHSELTIRAPFEFSDNDIIQIYSSDGQTIAHDLITNKSQNVSVIPVDYLAPGLYLYRISNGNRIYIGRFAVR